jgi:hypothetical protein
VPVKDALLRNEGFAPAVRGWDGLFLSLYRRAAAISGERRRRGATKSKKAGERWVSPAGDEGAPG